MVVTRKAYIYFAKYRIYWLSLVRASVSIDNEQGNTSLRVSICFIMLPK